MTKRAKTSFDKAVACLADCKVGIDYTALAAIHTNDPISLYAKHNQRGKKFPLMMSLDFQFFLDDYVRYLNGGMVETEKSVQRDDRPIIEIMKVTFQWIEQTFAESSTLELAREKFWARLRVYDHEIYKREVAAAFLQETKLSPLIAPNPFKYGDRIKTDDQFAQLCVRCMQYIAHEFFERAGEYKPKGYRISKDREVRKVLGL